jgi:hypothetical protein
MKKPASKQPRKPPPLGTHVVLLELARRALAAATRGKAGARRAHRARRRG